MYCMEYQTQGDQRQGKQTRLEKVTSAHGMTTTLR